MHALSPRAVRAAVCLSLALQAAYVSASRAQSPTDHLSEQAPPRPAYVVPAPDGQFVLPPVGTPGAVHGEPNPFAPEARRTIARIVFRGNTVVPSAELDAIAAPYLGRPLSANEIEDLRGKLTHRYVDAGFINSGALEVATPETPDALVFQIVEGRLEAIRVAGLSDLSDAYIKSRLDTHGAVLDVGALRERFQLLLTDPLIEQMNARLTPGSAPGLAELDIDVTRAAPYQLTAYYNNYRPPSIGAQGAGILASLHNLTGQGDALEINAQAPIEGGSALSSSVHWRMPVLNWGTSILVQYDRGASAVTEEPVSVLAIRSTLEQEGLGLEQVLYQSLRENFSVGLMRVLRENRTTLLGEPFSFIPGEPLGDTSAPLWRLIQDYSYRTEREVFALRSTFSFVRSNLETIKGLPDTIEPDRNYSLWLLQGQFAREVGQSEAQIILRATLQATRSHVLPLDSMTIGGDATLRGYRENQLLVDDGQVYNIEFNQPVYRNAAHQFALALVPFYDIGRGRDKGANFETLSDAGLAGQIHWFGAELDISKAVRLSYPRAFVTTRGNLQDRGVYFQLRYTLALR
jgi:hemolysin activation/secretion protein